MNNARSKVGINKLHIGSLYPTLNRMEKAKLIVGEFREPVEGKGSPRKKYYKLLEDGEIALHQSNEYREFLKKI